VSSGNRLVTDYHSTLRNTPEELRSHQCRCGSLKSGIVIVCCYLLPLLCGVCIVRQPKPCFSGVSCCSCSVVNIYATSCAVSPG
jgi:hypothetical protein